MLKKILTAGFASLFIFPHIALAQTACTNVNLYDEMQQSDPASYAQITAQANKTLNARGIFYKVSQNNTPHISWLFGTLHKSDPRILDLPQNVRTALANSKNFAGELDSSNMAYEMGLLMGSSPQLMFLPQGEKISDHLDQNNVAQLDLLLNERGADFEQINPMQPWVSMGLLSMSLCDLEHGVSDTTFLDAVMQQNAREAGLNIVGLETLMQQIEAITSIDNTFFYNSFKDAADQHRAGIFDDLVQTGTELYLEEEIGVLLPLMLHYSKHLKTDDANFIDFQRQLLDIRNKSMVEKSTALMAQAPSFVAVGALHLVGETGLVQGLRNAGFNVERIPLER